MKKLIITFIMVISLVLMLQVAVSADEMSYYCDAQITFTDNTTVTAYFAISTSQKSISRDSIYKTTNTSDGTYSWGDVKIVDMRGSTVIGGVTPVNFRGTECSKQAVNCERFYFPSCITEVLDSTFTSGWKKLEYVYLNKEITIIKNTSFQSSPIVTVEIEKNSQLKTIENSAFQSCSKLTSINLQEGLESIGRNGFYQSGLSGTFRVPDSVTYLAPGALLSTKIENLILGAGSLEIGYNFAGTFNSTDNAYLKNVYMPSETTFEANSSKYFFKCANPVNFYIVGDDCDTLVATLKSHSTGSYITFIEASEVTESTGAGYGIIHTGYNKCDAFYNGNHVERLEEGEVDTNPCVLTFCTVCEIENKYVGSDDTHTFAIEYSYENGYLAEGKKVSCCQNAGCKYDINGEAIVEVINPLFTTPQYSISDTGTAICVTYNVDQKAVAALEQAGKTVKYGVMGTFSNNVNGGSVVNANGEAACGHVIVAEATSSNLKALTFKIDGDISTWKQYNQYSLYMGGFVIVNGAIEYLGVASGATYDDGELIERSNLASIKAVAISTYFPTQE